MNHLKMLGLAAVAAMALMAVTAVSASATTLEVGGVTKNESLTIAASAEGSITFEDTEGAQANTCSVSSVHGVTSVSSGTRVTGSLSTTAGVGLSFTTCTRSPVTVDAPGGLMVEWEGEGTSGSVYSENLHLTLPTTFGFSVTCITAAGPSGTKLGTLTGSASANATLRVAAVLSCGFLLPSLIWTGSYKVTTPTTLGVTS